MNLSNFSTVGLAEIEVLKHDALLELKQRGHGGIRRLRKGVYPRSQFNYANYRVDPRPDVLKLGVWVHPKTGNTLLGGVNINYLSADQVNKLKKVAKQIFVRGTLRSRYRYLKRKLPDVAQYYRTYDEDYIHSDQPDEFKDFDFRDTKEPDAKDIAAQKQANIDRVADLSQEVDPEVDPSAAVEKDREAWAAKRRLYDPDTGRRTKPEREDPGDILQTKRQKLNRYRSQRRKLQQLERDAELERVAAAIKRDNEKTIDAYEEPSLKLPHQSEPGPYESVDYCYSLGYGFTWKSKASYIHYHKPANFTLLQEFCPGKTVAVYDMISKQTVIDAVPDRAFILEYTGWDYDHTITMEVVGNELVLSSEADRVAVMNVLSGLDYSKIATVLS